MFTNELEKSMHHMGYVHDALRNALAQGSAVDSLIILPLIKQLAEAQNAIENLLNAHVSDTK